MDLFAPFRDSAHGLGLSSDSSKWVCDVYLKVIIIYKLLLCWITQSGGGHFTFSTAKYSENDHQIQ